MSRRIFLDVGAHNGQSLRAAMEHTPRFDWIVCFEPVREHWKHLAAMGDSKVTVNPFGLWKQTCEMPVNAPGSKGASLWHMDNHGPDEKAAYCRFVRATEWFVGNVKADDKVWLKLNCEGAELDILDDLMESGEFAKVDYALVAFHGHKIAAQKEREAETQKRLAAFSHVTYYDRSDKTHTERIQKWLKACP